MSKCSEWMKSIMMTISLISNSAIVFWCWFKYIVTSFVASYSFSPYIYSICGITIFNSLITFIGLNAVNKLRIPIIICKFLTFVGLTIVSMLILYTDFYPLLDKISDPSLCYKDGQIGSHKNYNADYMIDFADQVLCSDYCPCTNVPGDNSKATKFGDCDEKYIIESGFYAKIYGFEGDPHNVIDTMEWMEQSFNCTGLCGNEYVFGNIQYTIAKFIFSGLSQFGPANKNCLRQFIPWGIKFTYHLAGWAFLLLFVELTTILVLCYSSSSTTSAEKTINVKHWSPVQTVELPSESKVEEKSGLVF